MEDDFLFDFGDSDLEASSLPKEEAQKEPKVKKISSKNTKKEKAQKEENRLADSFELFQNNLNETSSVNEKSDTAKPEEVLPVLEEENIITEVIVEKSVIENPEDNHDIKQEERKENSAIIVDNIEDNDVKSSSNEELNNIIDAQDDVVENDYIDDDALEIASTSTIQQSSLTVAQNQSTETIAETSVKLNTIPTNISNQEESNMANPPFPQEPQTSVSTAPKENNVSVQNTENQDISFEAALSQLELIVNKMETGNFKLEELLAAYEKGNNLAKICKDKLEKMERKVELLTRDNGTSGQWTPFEANNHR